jgi:neutral ceramidase
MSRSKYSRSLFIHLTLLLLLMTGLAYSQTAGSGRLRAGAAKVDITPPESSLGPGDSIRDHLFVRALVIDNGSTCAALVVVESNGFGAPDTIARASKASGCPEQNIIASGTHTHSGRPFNMSGGDDKVIGDAIVSAVEQAKAKLRPARIGYGTTQVHLNTNRDLFEGQKWYQGTNLDGVSDKTLAVVELIGEDDMPIGVYMNYAMHPINFFLSGVTSGDIPGDASRYIERRYPGSVAIFSQGAQGDQNPLFTGPAMKLIGVRTRIPQQADSRIGAISPWKYSASEVNAPARSMEAIKTPLGSNEMAAYKEAIAQTSELVAAGGAIIGESAIEVMKSRASITPGAPQIWAEQQTVSCPGRDRLDMTARQGVLPPYKDGDPVNLKVGLLRIGDIYFVSVNGEVYNEIAVRLKREAPVSKLMMVGCASGRANSGYIYSNRAGNYLTFQVIGSRLKPGCAEDKIVTTALEMIYRSEK